jgi:hypothetical protein
LTEALAWTTPAASDPSKPKGALLLFRKDAAPRQLIGFPAFVPTLAGCQHQVELTRTGRESVTLDVVADCPEAGLADRTPTRSILVIAPERDPVLIHALRLSAGAATERFAAVIDSQDLDSDGHDDVTATFSLERAHPEEAVEAKVVWLNRAAGVGRDETWPNESFADIGSIEVVRASGRNTSERVAGRVQNTRRLMAHLCAELASPRVSDDKGREIDCGDLQRSRDRLLEAEVKALLTRDLNGEALLAEQIASWYGPVSDAARQKVRAALQAAVPAAAAMAKRLEVRPRDPGPQGTFGPLAFAADDTLLVQTVDGLYRMRDGIAESAEEEVDPWPMVATGPHAQQWLGLALPCEKPFIELQARGADGSFQTLLTGRWLAPRPSSCSREPEQRRPDLRIVRWDARGLGVLLGGVFWGSEEALLAPALGSPVSPNGKHWVAPTSLGLFVQHEAASERWVAEGLENAVQCVIANDGQRVACVQQKTAWLLEKKERSD